MLDRRLLIGCIKNHKPCRDTKVIRQGPHQTGPETVKGAKQDPFGGQARVFQQGLHPTSHFLGSFVGKGQPENAPRRHPLSNQRSNAVGDHGGFATARPCIHQQRATTVIHHGPLGWCQASQKGLESSGRIMGFGQIHGWSLSQPAPDAASRPQPCDRPRFCNPLKHRDLGNTRQSVEDLVVRRVATTRYWGIFRPAPPSSCLAFWPIPAGSTGRRFVQVSVQ